MATNRFSFTDRTVSALPFTSKGQAIARDADLPGFFIRYGTRSKSYLVQGDLWVRDVRQTIWVKIGEVRKDLGPQGARESQGSVGIDRRWDRSAAQARTGAHGFAEGDRRRSHIANGMGQLPRKPHAPEGRSEGTIANYRDHAERLFADWLDQPLSVIGNDPALVKARHDVITSTNGRTSPTTQCAAFARSTIMRARRLASCPSKNPVSAIDWNPEHRRDTAMGMDDLPCWFAELSALENPIRREFHLFLLLSGSRPDVIKRSRREHLDLRRRILHIPNPRGASTARSISRYRVR